ncbi:MAG: hypothetical protein WD186_02360, partial [Actinomycetota bacterium]
KHYDSYLAPFLEQCGVTDVGDINFDVAAAFPPYLAGKAAPVTVQRAGRIVGERLIEPLDSALDPGTAGNITGVLRLLLESARLRGLIDRNPTDSLPASAKPREGKRKPVKSKAGDVPLRDVRDVARGLHVIHQTVLWMLRLLGLRISEAYGPHVGDLIVDGDLGLLAIGRQGGRPFLVRDETGDVVRRDEKERLKTDSSVRVVVVPPALLTLLRLIIEAYHTDPVTGRVDLEARLIPGIRERNLGGVAGFTSALRTATKDMAQFESQVLSPHGLRKSLATELSVTDVDVLIRRSWFGHLRASDVHHVHYVSTRIDSLRAVAEAITNQVAKELDGDLRVDTALR